MNPLVSHVCFLCFQEYDASVIVTSPNVPYKGACSYELDRLRKFAYSEPREFFFLTLRFSFDSNFSRQRGKRSRGSKPIRGKLLFSCLFCAFFFLVSKVIMELK